MLMAEMLMAGMVMRLARPPEAKPLLIVKALRKARGFPHGRRQSRETNSLPAKNCRQIADSMTLDIFQLQSCLCRGWSL